jgi:hypothetical protein
MDSQRFEFALDRLKPEDWSDFESLSSRFLADEFSGLRVVASQSGDEGRDAQLFTSEAEPSTLIQYSVSDDWDAKIRRTAKRLKETFPEARLLVYMSPKRIGAEGDEVRRELRKSYGISLDIRDRSWFVDRVNTTVSKERAAEELAKQKVDPLLRAAPGFGANAADLTSPEAVAALTYLGLQWEDDDREKGLTKLAFDALIRAALADTTSEKRLTEAELVERVSELLPGHEKSSLGVYVNSALGRLEGKVVKYWTKDKTYCLSYAELVRLGEAKERALEGQAKLTQALGRLLENVGGALGLSPEERGELLGALQGALVTVLLDRSQAFAAAVHNGHMDQFAAVDLETMVRDYLVKYPLPKSKTVDWTRSLWAALKAALTSTEAEIVAHLRRLADAFTLLAFLKETPDVQSSVEKMFSHGEIWLDGTVIVPLLSELPAGSDGRFHRMVVAAREAGLSLFVTSGVVEEVERHMNRALTCARMDAREWEGDTPLLLARYIEAGKAVETFAGWLELFRGDVNPVQDLADYLREKYGVEVRDLRKERDAAPEDLRNALQLIWHETHEERRKDRFNGGDPMTIGRLVEHDVEQYAGVVQLRNQEKSSPFGFSAWWLTLDRKAVGVHRRLGAAMKSRPPASPVLSADFLVNYLAFGPVRRKVSKTTEAMLPLIMDLGPDGIAATELLKRAAQIRDGLKDLPDHVVRRRVRDELVKAKMRDGPISQAGQWDLGDHIRTG